jgi:16S rRNA processing protein RimM
VGGEVRVDIQTDFPELRFRRGAELLIGRERSDLAPARILTARGHQSALLVHFEGTNDRDEAQALAGQLVWIRIEDAADLPAGSYYEHELIGLEVLLSDGSRVGAVSSIMETGAADVLVIKGPSGEHLVPLIRTVIVSVDREAGRILINPPPGLLD